MSLILATSKFCGCEEEIVSLAVGVKEKVDSCGKLVVEEKLMRMPSKLDRQTFDNLARAVTYENYDLALQILESNTYLATMRKDKETILHRLICTEQQMSDINLCKLAFLKFSVTVGAHVDETLFYDAWMIYEKAFKRKKAWKLAENLWGEIEKEGVIGARKVRQIHRLLTQQREPGMRS